AGLSSHVNVVALDQRGHGGGIRGPFTLEACADDAAALIGALGIGPVIAVGYSMGGPVATLLWRRHPELVAGIVLCATAPHFAVTSVGHLAISAVAAVARATAGVPGPARRTVRTLAAGVRGWAGPGWRRAALDVIGRHDPTAILEAARALVGYRADSWLGTIEVPAAVVMTTADRLVPPGRQLLLARGIPGCSLFAIDGDHGVCSVEPGRFVPALVAALADVGSRAQSRPRQAVATPSAA
ncbi:MAG TPA: alpha/beta hydrolase, partial [Acidimicrobiales bacterium]|nr:alpha/beta hydrolase [Acidimicrobiales bacterium]